MRLYWSAKQKFDSRTLQPGACGACTKCFEMDVCRPHDSASVLQIAGKVIPHGNVYILLIFIGMRFLVTSCWRCLKKSFKWRFDQDCVSAFGSSVPLHEDRALKCKVNRVALSSSPCDTPQIGADTRIFLCVTCEVCSITFNPNTGAPLLE